MFLNTHPEQEQAGLKLPAKMKIPFPVMQKGPTLFS
jgi:hypothetical protein